MGQFIVHADLHLSREVFVRNMYLHRCVCSEKKRDELDRKENQGKSSFSGNRRKDFLKDWPKVLNDRGILSTKRLTNTSTLVSAE